MNQLKMAKDLNRHFSKQTIANGFMRTDHITNGIQKHKIAFIPLG
jgi:hypothetical protein